MQSHRVSTKAGQLQDEATDAHAPKANDSEAVAAWRERMGSEEAQAIYKDRAATAECVNAQARNRGLLRLRGRHKVKCVAILFALAHNLLRMAVLAPAMVGLGTGTSVVAAGAG